MESGQYLDAVFHFQQSIEYMLKALLSAQEGKDPPREHDLLELTGRLKTAIPADKLKIVDALHDVSIPLRYPDDFDEALESYTYEDVKRIGQDTEELLRWLKQKLN